VTTKVAVQVRHHDEPHVVRVEAAGAQLVGHRVGRTHARVEQPAEDRAEVLLRIDRERRVEAGVDQHQAGARVLDDVRRDGDLDLLAAEAERMQAGEPPAAVVEGVLGIERSAGRAGMHAHDRLLLAARERQRGLLRLGGRRHTRAYAACALAR
jgi:hypothetical protein